MLPDLLLLLHPRPSRPSRHPHLLLPVPPPASTLHIHTHTHPLWLLIRCVLQRLGRPPGHRRRPPGPPLPPHHAEPRRFAFLLILPPALLSRPALPRLATVLPDSPSPALAARPGGSSTQRLAALLADLDARLFSLKDRLLAAADNGDGDRGHPILEPLDRTRDALLESAAATDGPAQVSCGDAMLGGVAREVAGYVGGWAKDALREISFTSSRKKPAKPVTPDDAAAATADAKINSDLLTMSN
ncbi:hypothetical protein ZWY2020_043157 [Hordeum vulgare]|nr:hypothetical protein ZWY2020_043157 [Hordeum vulgare]